MLHEPNIHTHGVLELPFGARGLGRHLALQRLPQARLGLSPFEPNKQGIWRLIDGQSFEKQTALRMTCCGPCGQLKGRIEAGPLRRGWERDLVIA